MYPTLWLDLDPKLKPDLDLKLWLDPDLKLWPDPDPEQKFNRNVGPTKKSLNYYFWIQIQEPIEGSSYAQSGSETRGHIMCFCL
jgi:hypothetical protein